MPAGVEVAIRKGGGTAHFRWCLRSAVYVPAYFMENLASNNSVSLNQREIPPYGNSVD